MTARTPTTLTSGIYTLPDAARILDLPPAKLYRWVAGYAAHRDDPKRFTVGAFAVEEEGWDRHFNFLTLIEVFTVAQLRGHGVTPMTLRNARDELSDRYETPYPFAMEGLLVSGRKMLKELGEEVYLELGTNGQQAFVKFIEPFCFKIEFDAASQLAERFFPEGEDRMVVVDPRHAFGRPVIAGTNITTEALASLANGGERMEDIADDYGLTLAQIESAIRFEKRRAA